MFVHPYIFMGLVGRKDTGLTKENTSNIPQPLIEFLLERRLSGLAGTDLLEFCVQRVCSHYKVSRKALFARTRVERVVMARQTAIYLMNKHFSVQRKYIAAYFEFDHTTIRHSLIAVNNRIDTEEAYKAEILRLMDNLKLSNDSIIELKKSA